MSYPSEGIYIRLPVDDRDRIMRETLAAGGHLVTRTFQYPVPRQRDGHTHEH